eukprot:CAMPEP_0196719752 /NCGR_PEP_ID=MMETSP1091-20130531/2685_1 /TAXON_ID=302021 /ORGANISM="Rhodomonas sp., Strain CCMP768" /LENGTH=378 /DNA_ID=CAMNT_0042060791 /DNA_START=236 /DNA_END=1372 /DNA_ORIENTATION=-
MNQVAGPVVLPAMFPNHLVDAKLALRASEPILVVGKKRVRNEKEVPARPVKKNRQDDVLKAIGDKPVTERHILETVGDNRYTREILRRLMAVQVVQRMGRGGSNDPFLYRVVRSASEVLEQGIVDPASDIRMQRIENKILALLAEQTGFVTEKQIRAVVGDNTGTGKALRRLVKNSRVLRVGRGGAGDPFTYQANQDAAVPFSLADSAQSKPQHAPENACSAWSPCESAVSIDDMDEGRELSDRSTVPSSSHSVTDEAPEDLFDDLDDQTDANSVLVSVMERFQRGPESHLDRFLRSDDATLERELSDSHSHSGAEDELDELCIEGGVLMDAEVQENSVPTMAAWVSQTASDTATAPRSDTATAPSTAGDTFVDSFLL